MSEEKMSDEKYTKIITQNGKYWKKALKKYESKIKRHGKRYCMIPFI